LVVTDGEDHGGGLKQSIERARAQGVRVFALGIGTPGGEPIPMRDAQGGIAKYKRDESDNVVVTKLNSGQLEEMARATGGEAYVLSRGYQEVGKLAKSIQKMEKGLLEERTFEDYLELFQVPLALCFLLLVGEAFIGDKVKHV
jgi:Ca-activated chloride channel family protein